MYSQTQEGGPPSAGRSFSPVLLRGLKAVQKGSIRIRRLCPAGSSRRLVFIHMYVTNGVYRDPSLTLRMTVRGGSCYLAVISSLGYSLLTAACYSLVPSRRARSS